MTRPRPVQLMIVGAPKAGTTALKNYLGQHPGICTHTQREMQFFANDGRYGGGYDAVFPVYFGEAAPGQVICGKSVAMMYSDEALSRLHRHNPEVHVVVSLRNPADRAYSEYWYARRRGWESLGSFEEAIRADVGRFGTDTALRQRCAYLERSRYAPYVASVLRRFPRDRVHVVLVEDLAHGAVAVCQELFGLFRELDPHFAPAVERRENSAALPRSQRVLQATSSGRVLPGVRTVVKRLLPIRGRQRLKDTIQRLNEREFVPPPMDPATRTELLEHFRAANRDLGGLLARDLGSWGDLGPSQPVQPVPPLARQA